MPHQFLTWLLIMMARQTDNILLDVVLMNKNLIIVHLNLLMLTFSGRFLLTLLPVDFCSLFQEDKVQHETTISNGK